MPEVNRIFQTIEIYDFSLLQLCNPHFKHAGADVDNSGTFSGSFFIHSIHT
jgi:hypothetical protein